MFEKLRTSGYLKTIIISLVIILLGVGTVVALDLYDAAQQPSAQPPVESSPAGGGDTVGGDVPGSPTGGEGALAPAGGGRFEISTNADGEEVTLPEGQLLQGTTPQPGTTVPEGGAALQPNTTPSEGGTTTTPPEGGATLQPGAGGGTQMKRDEDGTVHYYDADGNEVEPPQRQFTGQPGGEGRGAQSGMTPAQPPAETSPQPTKQGD